MFKSIFLTVLLSIGVFVSSFAQKRNDEIKKLMWESDEPGFKVTEVPDKWKNESAVILCESNYHEYRKEVYLLYLHQNEYAHKRIKLQDKSSVAEFSELTYPLDNEYFFGVKIIKPGGKEIIVDLKDAVVMEKAATNYYGYTYKMKYNKLAIPALEVGDIIDYYICMERTILVDKTYKAYSFNSVIYTLQDKYPIVKQLLEFNLKRRCFLNIKEYNNAPEIKVKEDPKDEATIYYMVDTDRDKVSEKLWHHPYRALPTIKFKVRYAAPASESYFSFLGSPTVPKTSISKGEIVKYVNDNFKGKAYQTGTIEAYLKKYHKTETDPEKIVSIAYNTYKFNYKNNSDYHFVNVMSSVLKKRKIPFQILVSVPKNISTLDEAIIDEEFTFMIKVNTAKPYYLSNPSTHSIMKEIDPLLQGADAYAINIADSELKLIADRVKIPVVPHTENNNLQKSNVSINEDFSALKVNVEVVLKGESKADDQKNLISEYDYKAEEVQLMHGKVEDDENIGKGLKAEYAKKMKEEHINKKEREKEELFAEREKALKADAESEYDAKILSVKNFELKQAGRWLDKPEMIYTKEMEMEGLLKKVGQNYILEAGKLIGKQIELTEDDKKRKFDIYMPYARSFNNEITIAIPDGYVVEGAESLNMDVKNKTGGFVSTATVSGNKLVITTSKYYLSNFEKAADWGLLEEFLEAAYKFTQQKVLLKKVQ